ncbi:MAG: hypothetical protein R2867_24175 [Caldilineaceae bacterium]
MTAPTQTTFIIHIWWETLSPTQRCWRGRVQHVLSGETFSFQEPSALWRFIEHWGGKPTTPPICQIQQKQMKG